MSFPSLSRERLGLLLGFIGMVIFGGTLPATRLAVSAIDPIALTSLRTAIAGLCSLALLAFPGTILGAFLGARVYHALSDRNFGDLVLGLLVISGAGLIWASFG